MSTYLPNLQKSAQFLFAICIKEPELAPDSRNGRTGTVSSRRPRTVPRMFAGARSLLPSIEAQVRITPQASRPAGFAVRSEKAVEGFRGGTSQVPRKRKYAPHAAICPRFQPTGY